MGEIWQNIMQFVGFRMTPTFADLIYATGATTEAYTLYVSSSGNDLNPGNDPSLPLRQITEAISRVPKTIRHLVKIEVAAGNYNGFHLSGFRFDPLIDGTMCGLQIYGTLQNAVLSTGSATGTVTSVATGVSSTATFCVVTDSTQSWTVDELRGKLLMITAGTGVGQMLPIISNTATTITVPASGTFGAALSTYAIQDCASKLDTACLIPGSIAGASGNPVAGAATNVGIGITAITGQTRSTYLRVEQFKVDLTGATAAFSDVLISGCQPLARIERCMLQSANGSALSGSGLSQISANFNYLSKPVATTLITMGGSPSTMPAALFNMSSSYVRGLGNGCLGFSIGGGMQSGLISNVQIDCDDMGIITGPCWYQMSGIVKKTFTSNNNFGLRTRIASNAPGGVYLHVLTGAGLELSNCGASTALQIDGPSFLIVDGTLLGTGNSTGLSVGQGGRAKIGATSTITGTTELSIDGVTDTLVAMRARSPKTTVPNNYGSLIFE